MTAVSAAVLLLAMTAFGWWAAARIDERSLARQSRAAGIGLEEIAARIPKEQDSSAIWDDAVLNARAVNEAWLDENLVAWMSGYYGHDWVYVLDPHDDPIRAAASGQSSSITTYEGQRQAIQPLVQELRQMMAEAAVGAEDSTAAVTGLGVLDYVAVGPDALGIVSARPIVPSTEAIHQAPGTEYVHVAVQLLDSTVTREIQEKFSLQGLTFVRGERGSGDKAAVPVMNKSGRILGFLEWQPDQPAMELIKGTAPVTVLAIIAAGLGLTVLLRRLRRTSTKLEISEAHAQYLAFHDSLTGVPNRALFEDRLERALAHMRRTKGKVALHYIDLDRFKHVNDTLGHPSGDELIRQASQRLAETIREVDTIARLGGDEFAIVQVDAASEANVERLCERMIEALNKPFDLNGDEVHVGASIGVAIASDPDTVPNDMMRRADIALYEAKASGRGRYEVFAGDMDQSVRERRDLERDLRAALNGTPGLALLYQPIFSTRTGELLGAEALVRWHHPIRGLLSPDVFIRVAEDRGLIDALGLWVLRTACTFAVNSSLPWVAVNVSPLQFRDEQFADRVLAVLRQTGLPANRLEIEITEGLLLQNSPVVQTILRQLRAVGIRIALDDFGTGYSSISYLRTYGVDKLKIDRSFVQQLGHELDIDSIVRSIIDLAHAMKMEVTAEGVETEEQRTLLIQMGCGQLQGFLMSPPIAREDLLTILDRGHHAA